MRLSVSWHYANSVLLSFIRYYDTRASLGHAEKSVRLACAEEVQNGPYNSRRASCVDVESLLPKPTVFEGLRVSPVVHEHFRFASE